MAGVLNYLFIYNIMFSYNCSLVCSHANLWEISPLLMLDFVYTRPITKLWVLVYFFIVFIEYI
ncbi:hypothetical protein Hdeb2414_s0004g00150221 [Helianthus debilis subsp. tardiflorus]